MKYMLLIYGNEQAWTDTERQECYVESTQLAHALKSNGQFLATSPLQPVSTATNSAAFSWSRPRTSMKRLRLPDASPVHGKVPWRFGQ
jgi:hypothetical protein